MKNITLIRFVLLAFIYFGIQSTTAQFLYRPYEWFEKEWHMPNSSIDISIASDGKTKNLIMKGKDHTFEFYFYKSKDGWKLHYGFLEAYGDIAIKLRREVSQNSIPLKYVEQDNDHEFYYNKIDEYKDEGYMVKKIKTSPHDGKAYFYMTVGYREELEVHAY